MRDKDEYAPADKDENVKNGLLLIKRPLRSLRGPRYYCQVLSVLIVVLVCSPVSKTDFGL